MVLLFDPENRFSNPLSIIYDSTCAQRISHPQTVKKKTLPKKSLLIEENLNYLKSLGLKIQNEK